MHRRNFGGQAAERAVAVWAGMGGILAPKQATLAAAGWTGKSQLVASNQGKRESDGDIDRVGAVGDASREFALAFVVSRLSKSLNHEWIAATTAGVSPSKRPKSPKSQACQA